MTTHTIDQQNGKSTTDDANDIHNELLTLFVQQLPEAQAAINTAFQQQENKQLADQLHKLLGACVYCKLPRLQKALETFIQHLRANKVLDTAMLEQLNQEINTVCRASPRV